MADNQLYTVIGMMSGSSHDGVDAALIKTDGYDHIEVLNAVTTPYVRDLREMIKDILNPQESKDLAIEHKVQTVSDRLTRTHIATLYELLNKAGLTEAKIDFIGFHGHTIAHDPKNKMTRQIGNAQMIANECSIPVIADFRSADVAAGGQGAPLAPIYHSARSQDLDKPLAILNLGGVGNVTYLGDAGEIIAFDTGPANALIDDWIYKKTGENFDMDGAIARSGNIDQDLVDKWIKHPYFARAGVKSLDRNDFDMVKEDIKDYSLEGGAATLTEFTIASIARAVDHLPSVPKNWLVTGGGRKNGYMMVALMDRLQTSVDPVETVGWNGDSLEAECFGYLAVRRFLGLPISFPSTTGVPKPMTGGVIFEPDASRESA